MHIFAVSFVALCVGCGAVAIAAVLRAPDWLCHFMGFVGLAATLFAAGVL